MQMKINHHRRPSQKTGTIPPAYAHLVLPDHELQVEHGNFGTLISQWLYTKEYSICVNHFDFLRPTSLRVMVVPCTTFYFAIKNDHVIYKGTLFPEIIPVEEGSMVKLVFGRSSERHNVKYQKGIYISLHITVPEENVYILNNKSWIWELLEEYDKRMYRQ